MRASVLETASVGPEGRDPLLPLIAWASSGAGAESGTWQGLGGLAGASGRPAALVTVAVSWPPACSPQFSKETYRIQLEDTNLFN